MAKVDNLFVLISNLDTSERRYFKIHTSNNSKRKDSTYIELFDILCKQKVYDEKKLIKKLNSPNFVKNLAQNKIHLKELILKSIRENHTYRPEENVNDLLKDQAFFKSKNLFGEQWKRLNKAKKITEKYELFDLNIKILDIEFKYLIEHNFDESLIFYDTYKFSKKELLYKISLLSNLAVLGNKLLQINRNNKNKINDDLLLIIENEMLTFQQINFDDLNSFYIKFNYLNCRSNFYRIKNDSDLYKVNQESFKLFDSFPHIKKVDNKKYIITYFNYLNTLFLSENFVLLGKELQEIQKIELNSVNEKREFSQNINLKKILYFINIGKLEGAIKMVPEVKAELNKYKNNINESVLIAINFNFSLVFFLSDQYDNCLDWLEENIKIKTLAKKELFTFSKILRIICHLEMKNYMLIESLVRSIRRSEKLSEINLLIIKEILLLSKNYNLNSFKSLESKIKKSKTKITGKGILLIWIEANLKKQTLKKTYLTSLSS